MIIFNSSVVFKSLFSVTDKYAFPERPNIAMSEMITNHLFPHIFHYFWLNLTISYNLYWLIIMWFCIVVVFSFFELFFDKKISLLLTLFIFLCSFAIIIFHTPIQFYFFSYISFPLLFLLFTKYIEEEKLRYLIGIWLFSILLMRAINVFMLSEIIVILILLLTSKWKAKHFINIFIIQLLVCIFFLYLNFITFQYLSTIDNSTLKIYWTWAFDSLKLYNILSIFQLFSHYWFIHQLKEIPWSFAVSSSIFYHSSFWIVLSFIPIALTIVALIFKKNRTTIIYSTTLIILIFLAKTINPPFGFIWEILHKLPIFSLFFRSWSTYFLFVIVYILAILIWLLILSKKNRLLQIYSTIILCSYLLVSFYINFIIYKPIHETFPQNITSLEEDASVLSKIVPINSRVLVMPITSDIYGYMQRKWSNIDFWGPSPFQRFTDAQYLTKNDSSLSDKKYQNFLEEIRLDNTKIILYKKSYDYILFDKLAINWRSSLGNTIQLNQFLNLHFVKISEWNNYILYKN